MAKITSDELKRELAIYLGLERSGWNTQEKADLAAVIDSGERQFYDSAIDPDTGERHVWSFLTRSLSISVETSDAEVSLPDDFRRLMSQVTVSPGGGVLPAVDDAHIRSLHASGSVTGKPSYYSLVKTDSGEAYNALLYPAADSNYTLTARYEQAYVSIDVDASIPEKFSEVLLASCLAAAERTYRVETGDKTQQERFYALLTAAVKEDRQMTVGQSAQAEIWPTDEEVDDLLVTKAYLKRMVGREFGYGAASGIWTQRQSAEVEEAVRSGLRTFYNPPPVPGERSGHEWSFLKGLAYLDVDSTSTVYDLPEDFARFDGPLTYESSGVGWPPVQIIGEYQIRELLQSNGGACRPTVAAIRPKGGDDLTRWEIDFYPEPAGEYQLAYRYWRNPVNLTDDQALPLGGQPHAQTVVDACLAAVESMTEPQKAIRHERFLERLTTSVWHDRKASAADTLGKDGPTEYYLHRNTSLIDATPLART